MNKLSATAAINGALWATALTLAAAATAAPSGTLSVGQVMDQLKADGYSVIVNRVGAGPPYQCTITAVRPGQTYSRSDSGTPGAKGDIQTTVVDKTVLVDLAC